MNDRTGLSRGDRNRNSRLARLRVLALMHLPCRQVRNRSIRHGDEGRSLWSGFRHRTIIREQSSGRSVGQPATHRFQARWRPAGPRKAQGNSTPHWNRLALAAQRRSSVSSAKSMRGRAMLIGAVSLGS
jgi:hypothetical protein